MEHLAGMKERETDARVIEACQQGDREAFRELFERYKDRVYSIAFSYSGSEEAAHDVTQHVFLKLFTIISQFRRESEFTTWLFRIVVNACTDEHRKRRRFVPLDEDSSAMTVATRGSQEKSYLRVQIAESVSHAIRELSPKLRATILLKYVEGLSYEEIAEVLRCSKGTVASRLNRGHKALARKLEHLRDAV